jgi:hypothetical protein
MLEITGGPWSGHRGEEVSRENGVIRVREGKRILLVNEKHVEAIQEPAPVAEPQLPANRYGAHCARCGTWVAAGEGYLVHLTDEEDIDLIGRGKEWLVYHRDKKVCERNEHKRVAEEEVKQAHEKSSRAEISALRDRVQARTGLRKVADFFDDDRWQHGKTLETTEHYEAYEVFDLYPTKRLAGFSIRKRG